MVLLTQHQFPRPDGPRNISSTSITAFDGANLDDTHAFPGCGGTVDKSWVQKLLSSAQRMVASKRAKMAWALGGKAKFIIQLDIFGTWVNRLHKLVSPAEFGGKHSGTSLTGPEVHMAAPDGYLTWLLLLCELFLTLCQIQPCWKTVK